MIHVVRNVNNEIIAFSSDLEYIFKYLSDFYSSDKREKIVLEISKVFDEEEIENITIEYGECELIEMFPGIIVTTWEWSINDGFLREFYENGKFVVVKTAIRQLSEHGKEVNDRTIDEYLRKSLKNKYYTLMDYNSFLESLGFDKIKELIGSKGISKYIYDLNIEYNRKISVDN